MHSYKLHRALPGGAGGSLLLVSKFCHVVGVSSSVRCQGTAVISEHLEMSEKGVARMM